MDKKTTGIIGNGFVGAILKRYYPEAKVWDLSPDRALDSLNSVLSCNYVFLAVNYQDNCVSDESRLELNHYFSQMQPGTVVIIKSTFVPGTLDRFQDNNPKLHFVYNPEFLTEMTAWKDFNDPQFQILGVPHQSLPLIHDLFELLPSAPIQKVISPKDAEMLKHAFNSYYASKVTWFNQLYDACQEVGADYSTVREIMVKNPWVGDSHSVIFHKGYRGFGGKCLSKDPFALTKVAKFPLLEKVIEINNDYINRK